MKKRTIYIILVGLFVLSVGFIVVNYNQKEREKYSMVYLLKDRTVTLMKTEEWKLQRAKFDELIRIVRTNPNDIPSRISLAALFIQEARVTGNYTYYDIAAMKYIDEVLALEPRHFEGLLYKSLLYLSQHHFAEGLAMAEEARKENPDNAFVYGILIDANVELGNYAAAVEHAERMISIRPDIRSYSRISYLREIHGDYPGAIEAMQLAVEAGPPGDEATEWARVQLGKIYETIGNTVSAALQYDMALMNRPQYGHALAGKGRLAKASGDYENAIAYFLEADSLVEDYTMKDELADLYELTNQSQNAERYRTELIRQLNVHASMGLENEEMGHYADRELATVYLKMGEYEKALGHGLAEYNRRPHNIDINETVAWIYYKMGNYRVAVPFAEASLKTNSRNPVLRSQAGLIFAAAGEKVKARELLQWAVSQDTPINPSLKKNCEQTLRNL